MVATRGMDGSGFGGDRRQDKRKSGANDDALLSASPVFIAINLKPLFSKIYLGALGHGHSEPQDRPWFLSSSVSRKMRLCETLATAPNSPSS